MAQSQESGDNSKEWATMLRQTGIRKRMKCSGSMAYNIKEAFVAVPRLLDAIESEEPLTETDGIGPKTAETIMEWYEHREERERNMPRSSVTERSVNSATIALLPSWAGDLGMESDDGGDSEGESA